MSVHGVQDVLGLGLRATHYHGGQQWLLLGGFSNVPFSGRSLAVTAVGSFSGESCQSSSVEEVTGVYADKLYGVLH